MGAKIDHEEKGSDVRKKILDRSSSTLLFLVRLTVFERKLELEKKYEVGDQDGE